MSSPNDPAGPVPDADDRPDPPVVIWAGDINLGRRQHYRTAEIGAEQVLGGLVALREADLRIANLECVVTDSGEQGGKGSKNAPYYYRARPEMLRILTSAHIDIVATANNHCGDYGPHALLEHGRWLDSVGIAYAGTGPTLEAALRPVVRRAGALNVAVFSLDASKPAFAATGDTPGSAYLNPRAPAVWQETLAPRIAAARALAHVVLVAVHWGGNRADAPTPQTQALARAIVDAGADAVMGASAHQVQGVEIYRQRPIVYDAGNLLVDSIRQGLQRGGVFALELMPHGVQAVRYIPVGNGFGYSVQLAGRMARKATQRFAALCSDLGTTVLPDEKTQGSVIPLSPPRRDPAPVLPPAPLTRFVLAPLDASGPQTAARGAVDHVPSSARIDPVRLGPLTLVGLRVRPQKIIRRRIVWVESFWRCDALIETDIRLNIRGVPVRSTTMPAWGDRMDHDPCDWRAPTSRWQPGVIYRDFCGLRAPQMPALVNVALRIEVGIVSAADPNVRPHLGPILPMAIPGLETISASSTPPSYRTDFPASVHRCQPGQTWTAAQIEEVAGGTWLVPPPEAWSVRSVVHKRSHTRRRPAPCFLVTHDLAQRQRHARGTDPKKTGVRPEELPELAPRVAGAMVSRVSLPVAGLPTNFPLLRVDDPIQAMLELGLAARQRYAGPVIGVTGTAGKSTTVGMLRHVLTELSGPVPDLGTPVLATHGANTTPMDAVATLSSLHPDHAAAIVEIAQSALRAKQGPVTRLIRPTISVITEIGISQSDRRVSAVEDTARRTSRIFDGLTGPAVAVIGDRFPSYDTVLRKAAKHARDIVVFGRGRHAHIRIVKTELTGDDRLLRPTVTLDTPQGRVSFRLPVPGEGMVRNAAATLAVVTALGQDVSAAAVALERYEPYDGRLRQTRFTLRNENVTVVDDGCNATVMSRRNAFDVLAAMPTRARERKVAVLGRIVDLGDPAHPLREGVADPLMETGVDRGMNHGPEMAFLRAKPPADGPGPHCTKAREVADCPNDSAPSGDLIPIKGSRRDSDFGKVMDRLTAIAREQTKNGVPDPNPNPNPNAAPVSSAAGSPPGKISSRFSLTEKLVREAAKRRNLTITRYPKKYFEVSHNGVSAIFRRNSPEHSVLASFTISGGHKIREYLAQNGLPIPNGAVFQTLKAARAFFDRVQANAARPEQPLCVKPAVASASAGITPCVARAEDLDAAWTLARHFGPRVVLEDSLTGRHVRILVFGGRAVGAYECLPPTVTGTGRDTIAALIVLRDRRRSGNPWLSRWPVRRFEALSQSGFDMAYVPAPGEAVRLSNIATVSNGCETVALGQSIHPSLLTVAEDAVRCFPGLHLGCVSLICDDPMRDRAGQSVAIVGLDDKPAIADLAFPMAGPALNIADDLLDYALTLARNRPSDGQTPAIRPAPAFVPGDKGVFALDKRVEAQILRHSARSRGLKAERLSSTLTRIADNSRDVLFYKSMCPGARVVARHATTRRKEWTKSLLEQHGVPTPAYRVFKKDQKDDAWAYIQKRGVPTVVKPRYGSWGRGVTTNVTTREHFKDAWRVAVKPKATAILIEDYAPGSLYRLFVVGNALVAAAEVLPPQVTGDGTRTIQALVAAQNAVREQDPCLAQCPVVLGPSALRHLKADGWTPASVPEAGRTVRLDTVANIGIGGTCQDVTDDVHPDFAPIAATVRRAVFDPPHVGIDLVARDISRPPDDQSWTIIEVNTNPDLSVHHFPTAGQSRDVAGALLDLVFPPPASHPDGSP